MTTPLEVETRRDALIDAALRVFRDLGGDATVADIASAAGVAKGSFYTYFRSKEHLVAALRKRYVAALIERGTAIFERVGSEDLLVLADEMVAALVDVDLEYREVVKLVRRNGDQGAPEMLEADERIHELVEAGIRVGVAAGLFDVPDPKVMAGFLDHAIHGYVEELIVQDEKVDRDAIVLSAQLLVRRALLAAP